MKKRKRIMSFVLLGFLTATPTFANPPHLKEKKEEKHRKMEYKLSQENNKPYNLDKVFSNNLGYCLLTKNTHENIERSKLKNSLSRDDTIRIKKLG